MSDSCSTHGVRYSTGCDECVEIVEREGGVRERTRLGVSTVRIYQAPFEQTAMGFKADADYEAVWSEPNDDASLESLWTRFQRVDAEFGPWPPAGYTGRSLSIGDVVEIDGSYWTPLAVGWRELDPDEASVFEVRA